MTGNTLLKGAIEAVKQGEEKRAKRLLVSILKREPENYRAWLWMSQIVEDEEKQAFCLVRALEIEPDHAAARQGLGYLLSKSEEWITPNPLLRAELAYRAGKTGEAIEQFRGITQAEPTNEAAWLWLSGLTKSEREQRRCLKRILKLNPKNHSARFCLSLVRRKRRRRPQRRWYTTILQSALMGLGFAIILLTVVTLFMMALGINLAEGSFSFSPVRELLWGA